MSFRFNIQRYAKKLFEKVSKDLKPYVFLIGIRLNKIEGSYPICIEPEECGVNVDLFKEVDKLANSIHDADPRKNILCGDHNHHKRYHEDLEIECLVKAVKQLVDKNFENMGKISFVSYPVLLSNYQIFIIMQFDEKIYNKFYSLQKSEIIIDDFRTAKVRKSLIDALVYCYLYEAKDSLYKPRAGVYMNEINTDIKELLRKAGANFIDTVIPAATASRETFDCYDICNYISSLKYEGYSSVGKLIICKEEHPNVDVIIKLKKPVQLSEYRKVRKLLEIASENLHLYSNGDYILGFARLKEQYNSENEDLFIINFSDSHKWELIHDSYIMMIVEYSDPHLPAPRIEKSHFNTTLKRIFNGISEDDIDNLWKIVDISTEQKRGTLIIISKEAKEEAKRLENQSMNIKPILLSEELIKNITSIDGAILLDISGSCHAVGVILDGIVTSKGSSARGARFNSAIRYVESNRGNCVAVIISEDGIVDLYPQLRPQIRKSEIDNHLKELKQEVSCEDVEYDNFRPIMNWFQEHEFYLSQEVCDEVNKLKKEFYSKLKPEVGAIHLNYHDFIPNPEMNDSYFLKE